MVKLFENLAVLDKKNDIIFERINDQVFCTEFFGQVLHAFDALTKHIADGELSNIEWGDKLITIRKENRLIFIVCCGSRGKEKKINEELEKISKRFFEIYSKVLIEDFEGDRSIFENSEKRFLNELKHLID